MSDCVFCNIVSGDADAHVIWEDKKHVAFLSRWPNTEGFSVVITKDHKPSYAFDNEDQVLTEITLAAKKVGKLIDNAYEDVGRTGMILEGFGVDHLHAKLFPMHGTLDSTEWKKRKSNIDTYFDQYEGYISSHDSKEVSDNELKEIAEKIRSFGN